MDGKELSLALWRELDRVRETKGWTRERLLSEINKAGGPRPVLKSLHSQMRYGHHTSWENTRWVVLALGLPEPDWKARWEAVDDKRRETRRSTAAEPATHQPVVALPALPPRTLPAAAIVATAVAVDGAAVYPAPHTDLAPLTYKARGEQITMPRDIPEFTGSDGRRYRMVRTPTRTPSGYAYMLAEVLVPVTPRS